MSSTPSHSPATKPVKGKSPSTPVSSTESSDPTGITQLLGEIGRGLGIVDNHNGESYNEQISTYVPILSKFPLDPKKSNAFSRKDWSTQSNPECALSEHIHLEWNLDFESSKIVGSVRHSIKVVKEGTSSVDFDSRDITVNFVHINSKPVNFKVEPKHAAFGRYARFTKNVSHITMSPFRGLYYYKLFPYKHF